MWLEFDALSTAPVALRLSWISPRKESYLFANRHGFNARSLPRQDLFAGLADGSIRPFKVEKPLFDRAMETVVSTFNMAPDAVVSCMVSA